MITQQKKIVLSQYTGLYDILVPADHFLRRLHDDIDFSFIYRELVDKYSESMGRTAYDPMMMFKYLILKVISKLSDVDLVNEVRMTWPTSSSSTWPLRRCRWTTPRCASSAGRA